MGTLAATDPRRRGGRVAEDGVFGMALAVFVEVMLFAGFISAFVIAEKSSPPGTWPPPNQPTLPIGTTALNTLILLASGAALFFSQRAYRRSAQAAFAPMTVAVLLGAAFVAFQGVEWMRLLEQGLTVRSSQLGSFFYTIIGAHALHAVVAILALAVQLPRMKTGELGKGAFGAAALFWYFVVLVWPVLYWVVYL